MGDGASQPAPIGALLTLHLLRDQARENEGSQHHQPTGKKHHRHHHRQSRHVSPTTTHEGRTV